MKSTEEECGPLLRVENGNCEHAKLSKDSIETFYETGLKQLK